MPAAAKADAEKAPGNPIVKVPKKWFAAAIRKHGFVVVSSTTAHPEAVRIRGWSRRSEGACRRADQAGPMRWRQQATSRTRSTLEIQPLNSGFSRPFNAITDRVGQSIKTTFFIRLRKTISERDPPTASD